MKNNNNIEINSEKIMKNEELKAIKGGVNETFQCVVICPSTQFAGPGSGEGCAATEQSCNSFWSAAGCHCVCDCTPWI